MNPFDKDPDKQDEQRQTYRAGGQQGHGQGSGRPARKTGGQPPQPPPAKKPPAQNPARSERFDPSAPPARENWMQEPKSPPPSANLLGEDAPPSSPVQSGLFGEHEPPPPRPAAPPPAQPPVQQPVQPQAPAQPQRSVFDLLQEQEAPQKTQPTRAANAGRQAASPRENLFESYGREDDTPPAAQPSVWELAGDGEAEETPRQKKKRLKKEKRAKRQKKPKREYGRKLRSYVTDKKDRWDSKHTRWRDLGWKRRALRVLKWCCILMAVVLVAGSIGLSIFWANSTKNDDLWLDLNQIPYKTETVLYYTDQTTGEVGVYATLPCTQNKEYVDGAQMPQYLRDAFVAVEDQKFYRHSGVDLRRTIYAVLNEVKFTLTGSYIGGESGRKQGASTINQQLVKNLTRDDEDSNMAGYLRKLREIYRAWRLDRNYSKDEILSAYLNSISFTGNTAGVQAESQKLFGKSVEELTLAECASLAAITRNPSRYNPVTNPENHIERRNYVLSEMLDQEYISQEEYDAAVATPLEVTGDGDPVREPYVTSYFTDAVMDEVVAQLVSERGLSRKEANNLLYNGGLRIYTTVVPELQAAMEEELESARSYPRPSHTVRGELTDEDGNPVLDEEGNPVIGDVEEYAQAAMVSMNYEGGICAVVGGLGEKDISRGFNRGMDAVRQVGSTMKGIAPYPLAIEDDDINWSTPFMDNPVDRVENEETGEMEDWPANVDRVYTERDILVREAFARSVNTIAVRVGQEVGNYRMYSFVKNDLEIPTFIFRDNKPGPLVLGSSTYGIAPVEMAKAYAMCGNGGYVPEIHTYTRITNGAGDELLTRDTPLKQVIGDDTAYIMNRLMREVMVGDGTASGMSVPGDMDSVGKTGTTSDHRDHWFIGLTPYYVTASWYGYDDNTALEVNYRSHPPTAAWRNVMQEAQQNLPYREFPVSESVGLYDYCTVSGCAAGPNCPSEPGYYKHSNPPRQVSCPVHGG